MRKTRTRQLPSISEEEPSQIFVSYKSLELLAKTQVLRERRTDSSSHTHDFHTAQLCAISDGHLNQIEKWIYSFRAHENLFFEKPGFLGFYNEILENLGFQ